MVSELVAEVEKLLGLDSSSATNASARAHSSSDAARYAAMKPIERANLKTKNPAEFGRLRAAWLAEQNKPKAWQVPR